MDKGAMYNGKTGKKTPGKAAYNFLRGPQGWAAPKRGPSAYNALARGDDHVGDDEAERQKSAVPEQPLAGLERDEAAAEVERLEAEEGRLAEEETRLEAAAAAHAEEVAKLEKEAAELEGQQAELEKEQADLDAELERLTEDEAAAARKVDELVAELRALGVEVEDTSAAEA